MKSIKKLISFFLVLTLILGTVSVGVYAVGNDSLKVTETFSVMSDLHFYPESLMGGKCKAWLEYSRNESKEYSESEILIKAGLKTAAERAKENGSKYIFIPGDLTAYSEYQAHVELAEILKDFEKESGMKVLVIPGNHDIACSEACTFVNGKKEPARAISANEFREVYKDLGYDLAYDEYNPTGDMQGGLSYVVNLDDNYSMIAVDSCIYPDSGVRKSTTNGMISEGLMKWIGEKAAEIKASGRTPMLMVHHGISAHMKIEPSVAFAFPIDNYLDVAEEFLSFGIHFVFTGHLHTDDISCVTNDDGETLYDCETASLTGFPNTYHEVTATTYLNSKTELNYQSIDVDDKCKVTVDGHTYDNNSFKYKSFALCFGGATSDDGYADISAFASGIIKRFALEYIEQISAEGGILKFLENKGINVEEMLANILKPYIGEGYYIGDKKIFSVENLMWFIEDLLGQVEEQYLNNTDDLINMLQDVIASLVDVKMSDVPCTKFIEKYHFGDKEKGGTLSDVILSVVLYWYEGNEDISDDAFLQDVFKNLDNKEYVNTFLNDAITVVFDKLLSQNILGKLDIRVEKIFGDSSIGKIFGDGVNYLLSKVLKNNFKYQNLVDTIFALGVLPYENLQDLVYQNFLKNIFNDDELEKVGYAVKYYLSDLCTDTLPQLNGDHNVTYSDEKVKVVPTREDYRLPTMVNVAFGENADSRVISWYSKKTLPASDIEIVRAVGNLPPVFTGIATKNSSITEKSELVEQSFLGIDVGGFGMMEYKFDMSHHTVNVSGLEAGAKYYYRVGNSEKGWWSETGTIEIEDGSKNVTFFHMSDARAFTDAQYENDWANVVKKAYNRYDGKFIVNTGNFAEIGKNIKNWQPMFDLASEDLMQTVMMPVSGFRDAKSENTIANNFSLANIPSQNTASGVYYSYDYNNVHFTVLNSNSLVTAQLEWLKNDVKSSSANWKIVCINDSSLLDKTMINALGVDLVLQGGRSEFENSDVSDAKLSYLEFNSNKYKTFDCPSEAVYVSSGMAGITCEHNAPQGYSAISVADGILYVDTYSVDGETEQLENTFAIRKDESQGTEADAPDAEESKDEETQSVFKKIINTILKIFTIIYKTILWYCF